MLLHVYVLVFALPFLCKGLSLRTHFFQFYTFTSHNTTGLWDVPK